MVVLVNLKFEEYEVTNFRRQEHLGLGYIASNANNAGYSVDVINAQFDDIGEDDVIGRIKSMKIAPTVLGLSLYEMQLQSSIDFLQKIKAWNPSVITVVGGHFATFNAHEILNNISFVDLVVVGEGELSFVHLLNEIKKGEKEYKTKGVCYRKNNIIIDNGISDYVKDLDSLPYALRSDINREKLITNISSGRGCYGNCSFCSTNAFDKKQKAHGIRIRNPLKIVEEIEHLVKKNNAYHFFFTDDNFLATELVSPGWITTFTDEIKRRNLKIIFNFDCRVDDVDVDSLKLLKEIGLIGVFLGVESNSENTLQVYNKETSLGKNINAIKVLRKLRIDYWIGNIMFHPLTTLQDIEADVRFFDDINYTLYFNYANPVSLLAGRLMVYKGTPIYEVFKKQGLITANGLTAEYTFKHKNVNDFYDFISLWRKKIEPFVEIDTVHLLEISNELKKSQVASELHTASRKYMRLDFDVFKNALEYFKQQDEPDTKGYFNKTIENKQSTLDDLYSRLINIRAQLL